MSGLTGRERTQCKSPALFEASLMPLQFKDNTDNAIENEKKENIIYSSSFARQPQELPSIS